MVNRVAFPAFDRRRLKAPFFHGRIDPQNVQILIQHRDAILDGLKNILQKYFLLLNPLLRLQPVDNVTPHGLVLLDATAAVKYCSAGPLLPVEFTVG
jgi:hypothetical protein